MNKKDLKNSSFVMNINSSIQDAMEKITDNHRGTVVVVDDEFYVEGIVADGDIRRAIVKGVITLAPVSKIINSDAVMLSGSNNSKEEAKKIFSEHASMNLLPVVDKNNKLINLLTRDTDSLRSKAE